MPRRRTTIGGCQWRFCCGRSSYHPSLPWHLPPSRRFRTSDSTGLRIWRRRPKTKKVYRSYIQWRPNIFLSFWRRCHTKNETSQLINELASNASTKTVVRSYLGIPSKTDSSRPLENQLILKPDVICKEYFSADIDSDVLGDIMRQCNLLIDKNDKRYFGSIVIRFCM